jgi:hypothetical protein
VINPDVEIEADEVSIYCAEIFPNAIRGKGMAIAVASYLAALLMQLTSAPSAYAALGWKWVALARDKWTMLIRTQVVRRLPLCAGGDNAAAVVYPTGDKGEVVGGDRHCFWRQTYCY